MYKRNYQKFKNSEQYNFAELPNRQTETTNEGLMSFQVLYIYKKRFLIKAYL